MAEPIIECVPNFSEGRSEPVMREILAAMRVYGVSLLDWSMDAAHNRSVATIAGAPEAVAEAAIRGAGRAAELIDLTQQDGVHPRIGAADVVPFVPVAHYTLGQCAALARHAGLEIWRRFAVPVYFYEASALRPDRVRLEDVRRGQFEGLREAVRTDSNRQPDVGASALHSTAGATAVGARQFLIAYNIYLEGRDVSIARGIARELRASNGGMQGVKAMGVMVDGRPQVSMNITDFRTAPVQSVHTAVCALARNHGVKTAEGELVGLLPEAAYDPNALWVRQTRDFDPAERVLERRLEAPMPWPEQAVSAVVQR